MTHGFDGGFSGDGHHGGQDTGHHFGHHTADSAHKPDPFSSLFENLYETASQAGTPNQETPKGPPSTEIAPYVKTASKSFRDFLNNEKWLGKKGLVFAGAVVAMGVVLAGANKFITQQHQKAMASQNKELG